MWIAARGLDANPALPAWAQVVNFHQTADASLGGEETTLSQLTHQTRAAIGLAAVVTGGCRHWRLSSLAAVVKGVFQSIRQNAILTAAQALWFVAMRIKAAGRNT